MYVCLIFTTESSAQSVLGADTGMGLIQGVRPHLVFLRGDSALPPNAASPDLASMAQLSGPTATFGCHLVLRKKTSQKTAFLGKKRLFESHSSENKLREYVAYIARQMGIICV